jgi:hypothetical protein
MKPFIIIVHLLLLQAIHYTAQIAPGGSAGVQLNSLGRGYLFETKNFRLGLLQPHHLENGSFLKPSVEYRYAFQQEKLSMGTRFGGFSGWSIYPQISGGLTIFNEKPIGQNTQQKSWGLIATPSVNFTLPFCVFEIGAQTNFYFNNTTSEGKFSFLPTVSLRLDGLMEVLDPELTNAGSYGKYVTTQTGQSSSTSDYGSYKVTTTTTYYKTEYKTFSYVYKSINPFMGITPRFSYADESYAGMTKMYGLGWFYRFSQFMLDAIVETGTQGYASEMNKPVYIQEPNVKENDINTESSIFNATGQQTRMYVRTGIDVHHFLKRLFMGVPETVSRPTPLWRIMGGVGFGYGFASKPTYINPEANQLKDEQMEAYPDLWRNPVNDVRRTTNGLIVHSFFSLEFGVVSFEWSNTWLANSPLSRGARNFGVSYTIPISQILEKSKEFKD